MEQNRGPAAARNVGLRRAREQGMDLVCFMDADCEPQPSWLAEMEAFQLRQPGIVCGLTMAASPTTAIGESATTRLLASIITGLGSAWMHGNMFLMPCCMRLQCESRMSCISCHAVLHGEHGDVALCGLKTVNMSSIRRSNPLSSNTLLMHTVAMHPARLQSFRSTTPILN